MHPFLRSVVVGAVGVLIAGGLLAVALLTDDSDLSVQTMLAASVVGTLIGMFGFVQGWLWSQRAWRRGFYGRAVAIAFAGGMMVILAAVALAAGVILVLLFNAA